MLLTAAQHTEHGSGHRSKDTCNKQDLLHTHLLLPRKKNRLPDPTAKNSFQNAPCHSSLTFSRKKHTLSLWEKVSCQKTGRQEWGHRTGFLPPQPS